MRIVDRNGNSIGACVKIRYGGFVISATTIARHPETLIYDLDGNVQPGVEHVYDIPSAIAWIDADNAKE